MVFSVPVLNDGPVWLEVESHLTPIWLQPPPLPPPQPHLTHTPRSQSFPLQSYSEPDLKIPKTSGHPRNQTFTDRNETEKKIHILLFIDTLRKQAWPEQKSWKNLEIIKITAHHYQGQCKPCGILLRFFHLQSVWLNPRRLQTFSVWLSLTSCRCSVKCDSETNWDRKDTK